MTKGNPKWEQFEQQVQKLLDLRSTPGSGNQWHDVGDGVSRPEDPYKLIVDCKFTESKSYSLNAGVLQKWWDKATGLGYYFALPVRLDGHEDRIKEWVTVPLDDYAELLESHRLHLGTRRCNELSAVREQNACCRRVGHFGHHDNGEIEWST